MTQQNGRSGSAEDLRTQLATKPATSTTKASSPADAVRQYLEKMKPEFARALPKHLNADRMARVALTVIRTNPKLLECTIPSLMGAVIQCAQLGLEPGLLGHAYLVPFRNNKTNQTDVQFILGYRGMIDLARRSGNIQSIYAYVVHDGDVFAYEYGLHPALIHKPAENGGGKPRGAYAVAHFKDGGYQFEFMSVAEIERRRKRSKAADSGPWVTDFEEMAMKTVVRHMFKFLPVSVEIMRGVEMADESVTSATAEAMAEADLIDITPAATESASPADDLAGSQNGGVTP